MPSRDRSSRVFQYTGNVKQITLPVYCFTGNQVVTLPGFACVLSSMPSRVRPCRVKLPNIVERIPAAVKFSYTLTGTSYLIMHNVQAANPLSPFAKEMKKITSKRSKTDEDYADLAKLEFAAGLYYIPEIGPFMPAMNIRTCLLEAARMTKSGKKIERGLVMTSVHNPLAYDGPRDLEALWAEGDRFRDMAMMRVQMSRTLRCRPMFREWATAGEGMVDTEVLDVKELVEIFDRAGVMIGLGDSRKLGNGRFTASVEFSD
jgi:hypothetical protein